MSTRISTKSSSRSYEPVLNHSKKEPSRVFVSKDDALWEQLAARMSERTGHWVSSETARNVMLDSMDVLVRATTENYANNKPSNPWKPVTTVIRDLATFRVRRTRPRGKYVKLCLTEADRLRVTRLKLDVEIAPRRLGEFLTDIG